MKTSFPTRLLSFLLTAVMIFTMFPVSAGAANGGGKYIKDVYISYATSKASAIYLLRADGWEPFEDLNDGKNSKSQAFRDIDIVMSSAVLGIKRTDDPNEAITDMAVMNMKGGYSFDDYEGIVEQKKTDITEFINTFIPALNEYRDNYNGKGSEGGQKRAQMVHDLLNKFYDGDPKGEYAVNDTGKPLGDLLLNKTKTEIGDDAYNALSAEQKLNTADLQQIILESSGPAVMIIEQSLALATDTNETSWLDRLNGLSGEGLVERIAEFAPEAKGQNLARSAAMSLLASRFEDYAKKLADGWINVHDDIVWYENYCNENNLWPEENEADEAFTARLESFFNDLSENDNERYLDEYNHFTLVASYYDKLWEVEYKGVWGETLYDFFCPEDEQAYYGDKYEYFAPLAASLSDGQRAALEFLSLSALLRVSMNSDSVTAADFPSVDTLFRDKNDKVLGRISIYSGINRGIFRKGVALTSKALQQKALGSDPYEKIWKEEGIVSAISYAAMGAGFISLIIGYNRYISAVKYVMKNISWIEQTNEVGDVIKAFKNGMYQEYAEVLNKAAPVHTMGRWLMGIGGALMLIAVALKLVQLHQYYNRTFTMIPNMIVDEADIVTTTTDEYGKQVQNINFDQFAYYEVVKCNRQRGLFSNAQYGVEKYAEWGCGDAADINADVGKQWLALYVNRSAAKGNPILADSLKLVKGTAEHPEGYTKWLHMFGAPNALKIDDEQYCYRSDNNGMYLYWKDDENAFADANKTASAFGAGYTALSGVGGLALGIAGTAIFTGKKKKKEEAAA